jgi:hypothetical protein
MSNMTVAELEERIEAIVAAENFGGASAAKRGRNPKFPYVPVIQLLPDGGQLGGCGSARTIQLRGLAYATREQAIGRAERQILADRRRFRKNLWDPGCRVLRERHGLPCELAALS